MNLLLVLAISASVEDLEADAIRRVNEHRASRNLPPLKVDPRVSEIARAQSAAMARREVPFGHAGFSARVAQVRKVVPLRGAAENMGRNLGHDDPVERAVESWLGSPGHLHNIEGNYDTTGLGAAVSERGEYFFTQIFVRRR